MSSPSQHIPLIIHSIQYSTPLSHLLDQAVFWLIRVMVFNATFNNISAILWHSALLVEETRVPGGNQQPNASHRHTLSHNVVSSIPRHERGSS